MNKQDFKKWQMLQKQFENGYHLSTDDWQELRNLNHIMLRITHDIHNADIERGAK